MQVRAQINRNLAPKKLGWYSGLWRFFLSLSLFVFVFRWAGWVFGARRTFEDDEDEE